MDRAKLRLKWKEDPNKALVSALTHIRINDPRLLELLLGLIVYSPFRLDGLKVVKLYSDSNNRSIWFNPIMHWGRLIGRKGFDKFYLKNDPIVNFDEPNQENLIDWCELGGVTISQGKIGVQHPGWPDV